MPKLQQLIPGVGPVGSSPKVFNSKQNPGLIFENTRPSPSSAKLHSRFRDEVLQAAPPRASLGEVKFGQTRERQVQGVYSVDALRALKTSGKARAKLKAVVSAVPAESESADLLESGSRGWFTGTSHVSSSAPLSGTRRAEKYGIDVYGATEALETTINTQAFGGCEIKFDKKKQVWHIPQPLGTVVMPKLIKQAKSASSRSKSKASKKGKYFLQAEHAEAENANGSLSPKESTTPNSMGNLGGPTVDMGHILDAAKQYVETKEVPEVNQSGLATDSNLEESDFPGIMPPASPDPELNPAFRTMAASPELHKTRMRNRPQFMDPTSSGGASKWNTLKSKVRSVVKFKMFGRFSLSSNAGDEEEDEETAWLKDCKFRSRGELPLLKDVKEEDALQERLSERCSTPTGKILSDMARFTYFQPSSLEDLQETLEAAGIDLNKYGQRPAKSTLDLWDEYQDGKCEFLRPVHTEETVSLIRRVRVIRIRVTCHSVHKEPELSEKGVTDPVMVHKVLVSQQQTRSAGHGEEHVRVVKRLPAILVEQSEGLLWSAMKCLRDELGLDYAWQRLHLDFNIDNIHSVEEHSISQSYPDLMTSYTFQELTAEVKDPHRAGHLGLPELNGFETSIVDKMEGPNPVVHRWSWVPLDDIDTHFKRMSRKPAPSSMSAADVGKFSILGRGALVHRFFEAGLGPRNTVRLRNVEHLVQWLERSGIEVSCFGIGRTKTLESLWREYESEKCWFDRTMSGTAVRVIRVVRIRMQAADERGHLRNLSQKGQKLMTGRIFSLTPRLPAKIARMDEEVWETVHRVMESLFHIPAEWCSQNLKIYADCPELREEEGESKGYPGLITRYFLCDVSVRLVDAFCDQPLLGLPNFEDFDSYDENGLCGKGVRNMWTWSDEGLCSASKRSSLAA
eukprot:gnl/MRDRNA2_/MRDRNA2_65990_c0_seq1.p1 gnl/MRDRNA2_/MRDRNA2_65990_c0~~gnl/MRDRNA2_/MRDRNA2_65990_c0_seq1.p1  ORF type:complete len:908 (-),score=162.95 gnl/MRDRNA2_/MRDRNA2_65990_c0_seq1:56-2779(-)